MTWLDFNQSLLALVLWREAQGEGREGMLAVACVIRNRGHNTALAETQAMEAKWQFSSMTAPGDFMLTKWPLPGDKAFEVAMDIVTNLDTLPDITNGATHYFATSIPAPKWAETMTFLHQFGRQRFYK